MVGRSTTLTEVAARLAALFVNKAAGGVGAGELYEVLAVQPEIAEAKIGFGIDGGEVGSVGVIVGSGNERSNNRDTAEGLDSTQEIVRRGGLGIGGDQPHNLETQELLGGFGIGAKSGLVGALAVGLFQLGGGAGVGFHPRRCRVQG